MNKKLISKNNPPQFFEDINIIIIVKKIKMNQTKKMQGVAYLLNEYFISIRDFEVVVKDKMLMGGFLRMKYKNRSGDQVNFFYHRILIHEAECKKLSALETFEEIKAMIIQMLAWQKENDTSVAKAFNREIIYLFDYAILDSQKFIFNEK